MFVCTSALKQNIPNRERMSNKLKLFFVNRELCSFKLLFEMVLPVYLNFFAYYRKYVCIVRKQSNRIVFSCNAILPEEGYSHIYNILVIVHSGQNTKYMTIKIRTTVWTM